MAAEDLTLLTTEQLQKKQKDCNTAIKVFAAIFIVYFIVIFIGFVVSKKFNFSMVAFICLLPIYASQKNTLKRIEEELGKRNS